MVAAVLVPAIFLIGLELTLKIVNYGYPTRFFEKTEENGRQVLIENPQFTWRFMPPSFASAPQPMQVSLAKPPGTYRVIVFGESAAMGDPEPAFGFPRVLQAVLEGRYPGRRIEVINTAFQAINSHVIREIAADCRPLHADLWIIYMGNNEVIGPFGLSSGFGSAGPNEFTVRTALLARRLRIGQLLTGFAARFRPALPATPREMQDALAKEPVELDDPRLGRLYRHFQNNLEAILDQARSGGTAVIVSTVASNLKDCAPFLPAPLPRLPEGQITQWQVLVADGRRDLDHSAPQEAIAHLTQAAALQPAHAELQFQLGRASLALGRTNDAKAQLSLARDLDRFRARTDSH